MLFGVAFALPAAAVLAAILLRRRYPEFFQSERFQGLMASPWRPVVWGSVIWAGFTSLPLIFGGGGSVLVAMIGALPMAGMFTSFSVLSISRKRRGKTVRCAACEYDLSGIQIEGGGPDPHARCPECGGDLGKRGGTVLGEKVWSRGAIVIAVLLLIPILATFIVPAFAGYNAINKVTARILPTGSLIRQISCTKGFRMDEWAELRTRTLTPEQCDTLAAGLLTRDALQLHAWSDEAKWLVAEFAAGRLSPESHRKVLARYVDIELFPIDPVGTMSIRPTPAQAWGMQGCFAGWTIFAVRGPVLDASNQEIAPSTPDEIEIGQAELGTPSIEFSGPSSPRTKLDTIFGTIPPGGHLSVWIIAEPRVRSSQPVVWNNGVPATAADAIVVRFDLKPPTK